jgi:hypothetical protein
MMMQFLEPQELKQKFFKDCFENGRKMGFITTTKGYKVMVTKYSKDNGRPSDQDYVMQLRLGMPYEIEKLYIGGSSTQVYLKGFEHSFNSVNFEDYDETYLDGLVDEWHNNG